MTKRNYIICLFVIVVLVGWFVSYLNASEVSTTVSGASVEGKPVHVKEPPPETKSDNHTKTDESSGHSEGHIHYEGSQTHLDVAALDEESFETYCHDTFHISIYELGSRLTCRDNTEGVWMSLFLAFTVIVIVERAVHFLQHVILRRHKVLKEVMQCVIKELMMMGLISFSISIMESLHFFEKLENLWPPHWKHAKEEEKKERAHRRVFIFEYVHVTLFITSMFYIVITLVMVLWAKIIRRRWRYIETFGDLEVISNYNKCLYNFKKGADNQNIILRIILFPLTCYRLARAIEFVNYRRIRARFLASNRLSSHFCFDIYLRKRIQGLLLNIVEISWIIWLLGAILSIVVFIIERFGFHVRTKGDVFIFIGVFEGSCLFIIVSLFIYARGALSIYNYKITNRGETFGYTISDAYAYHLIPDDNTDNRVGDLRMNSRDESSLNMRWFFIIHPFINTLLLQVCVLLQSFYLASMCTHYAYILATEYSIFHRKQVVGRFFSIFTAYLISVLIVGGLFPLIAPIHTILSSVENYSDQKCIAAVLRKMKHMKVVAKGDEKTALTEDTENNDNDTYMEELEVNGCSDQSEAFIS